MSGLRLIGLQLLLQWCSLAQIKWLWLLQKSQRLMLLCQLLGALWQFQTSCGNVDAVKLCTIRDD
jgi:hypothetical protein